MQDDLKIDSYFSRMLSRPPQAIAQLAGDVSHPNLSGTVKFYQLGRGVLLSAYFTGLPTENSSCPHRVFGLHIHEKEDCSGNELDPICQRGEPLQSCRMPASRSRWGSSSIDRQWRPSLVCFLYRSLFTLGGFRPRRCCPYEPRRFHHTTGGRFRLQNWMRNYSES